MLPPRFSVCERNFTQDCFSIDLDRVSSLGYSRISMRKDVVLAIFDYTALKSALQTGIKNMGPDKAYVL